MPLWLENSGVSRRMPLPAPLFSIHYSLFTAAHPRRPRPRRTRPPTPSKPSRPRFFHTVENRRETCFHCVEKCPKYASIVWDNFPKHVSIVWKNPGNCFPLCGNFSFPLSPLFSPFRAQSMAIDRTRTPPRRPTARPPLPGRTDSRHSSAPTRPPAFPPLPPRTAARVSSPPRSNPGPIPRPLPRSP